MPTLSHLDAIKVFLHKKKHPNSVLWVCVCVCVCKRANNKIQFATWMIEQFSHNHTNSHKKSPIHVLYTMCWKKMLNILDWFFSPLCCLVCYFSFLLAYLFIMCIQIYLLHRLPPCTWQLNGVFNKKPKCYGSPYRKCTTCKMPIGANRVRAISLQYSIQYFQYGSALANLWVLSRSRAHSPLSLSLSFNNYLIKNRNMEQCDCRHKMEILRNI